MKDLHALSPPLPGFVLIGSHAYFLADFKTFHTAITALRCRHPAAELYARVCYLNAPQHMVSPLNKDPAGSGGL